MQGRLSGASAAAVRGLLPSYAGGNLSSLCSWADGVKLRYPWSAPLHYIDTPDHLCSYTYDRDCKDEDGVRGRCVAGAINNYTSQLLTYDATSPSTQYNLTQALLFLAHFMGDIHQVWDDNIIETAENNYYGEGVAEFVDALMQNITGEWSQRVPGWEECSKNQTTCPDTYASESIAAACDWAYKDVTEDSVLEDCRL
uniref:Aspergillus nuclease S1 n=1 Tax=Oryza meridionalis TaxID=40149 RepID=A0A0E0BWF5_9ORYZ